MKRLISVLAATAAMVGLGAAPAAASVDSNPNAYSVGPVTCPGTDVSFELIWSPVLESPVGQDLDMGRGGVAKAVYVVLPDGTPVGTVFERPGKGLDKNTVFCYWPEAISPTGFIGADILLHGNNRP